MTNSQFGLFIFAATLFLAGIMFLFMSILMAFFGKGGSGYALSSGITALIFAVVLFATSEGKINEWILEFGGLKTQMKKAQEVINEGNATIEQLRQVALTYAEPSFVNLALSGNFMVGMTAEKKVEFRKQLATSLGKLGLTSVQIDKAAESFDEMFIGYHRNKFLGSLTEEQKRMLPANDMSLERVHAAGLHLSPESKELLEDWEYYEKNKKLRRPEQWRYHAAG